MIGDGSDNNTVLGNIIGLGADGFTSVPNGTNGVQVQGSDGNVIGGLDPGQGNILSANAGDGLHITGARSAGNKILGNKIGTAADGTTNRGNRFGVEIDSDSSGTLLEGNVIAFSGVFGVGMLAPSDATALLGNSIFSNASLGIDLESDQQVEANDADDMDAGPPNRLQNFPVLTSAVSSSVETSIEGSLDSEVNTEYRIEFFANSAADCGGSPEARGYLGATDVTTDNDGDAAIVFRTAGGLGAEECITATATQKSSGEPVWTSEISASVNVRAAGDLRFDSALYAGKENGGEVTVTVTRTGGDEGVVTVNYATREGGTAVEEVDYKPVSGTLSFGNGETSKTFVVAVLDDGDYEGNETIALELRESTGGASVSGQDTALLTVTDDETCGNGIVDGGEECDEGLSRNDDVSADACRTACVKAHCGDEIRDAGESCDDGNNAPGDGCDASCGFESSASGGQIEDANPGVAFDALEIGQEISLNAPDPRGGGAGLSLKGTHLPETCACEWSIDPEALGAYASAGDCHSGLTLGSAGAGMLTVEVDCGADGEGTFQQAVTVLAPDAGESASPAASGGCSLIQ